MTDMQHGRMSGEHSAAAGATGGGAEWGAAVRYLAGVDGGGSTTRVRLHDLGGCRLGDGVAGPAALSQGTAQAWRHVQQALAAAFADAGLPLAEPAAVALGLGLAGAGLAAQRDAFLQADPGFARCVLDTDAATQLLGAHAGGPGIVVAAGTGSVAAARAADGTHRRAGGWGFPVGDEGSGAWLGLRAMQAAQAAIDGRGTDGLLVRAVLAHAGAEPGSDDLRARPRADGLRAGPGPGDLRAEPRPGNLRAEPGPGDPPAKPGLGVPLLEAGFGAPPAEHGSPASRTAEPELPDPAAATALLLAWCARAQAGAAAHAYAELAPLVFRAADAGDAAAQALLQAAADALARLVAALQTGTAPLPVVASGSIGVRLAALWPQALRARLVPPAGDSADGALRLLRLAAGGHPLAPDPR